MTVYITQEVLKSVGDGSMQPQYNFNPARKYGELVVLIPGNLSLVSTVPVVRLLKEKLANFNDDDYLLAVGDPSIVAVASMLAGHKNNGKVKLLKWDRHLSDYIPLTIDISGRIL
jgi:hypothetical protein